MQERRLVELGIDVQEIRALVARELDAAVDWALEQPMPDPADAADGVFCEGEAVPLGDGMAPYSGYAREGVGADA
jgi:hypothetical protein